MEVLIFIIVGVVVFLVVRSITSKNKKTESHNVPSKYFEEVETRDIPTTVNPTAGFYGDFKKSENHDPYFAVFNIENDGKPDDYGAPYKDIDNWPLPMRIEYYVFNENKELVFHKNLALDRETNTGSDIYKEFFKDMRNCKALVTHNMDYRIKGLKADFIRNNIPFSLFRRELLCTMESTDELVGIPSDRGDYKWPKLKELVAALYFPEEDPERFEPTEKVDFEWETRAMAKCFVAL